MREKNQHYINIKTLFTSVFQNKLIKIRSQAQQHNNTTTRTKMKSQRNVSEYLSYQIYNKNVWLMKVIHILFYFSFCLVEEWSVHSYQYWLPGTIDLREYPYSYPCWVLLLVYCYPVQYNQIHRFSVVLTQVR